MNNSFGGAELVALWRNGGDSPAGPLFASGNFAEADIVNATFSITEYSSCSGSLTHPCC